MRSVPAEQNHCPPVRAAPKRPHAPAPAVIADNAGARVPSFFHWKAGESPVPVSGRPGNIRPQCVSGIQDSNNSAIEDLLDVAYFLLRFAFDLIAPAFRLQTLVTDELASAFLDFAFEVFGGAFSFILGT